jgi:hypothetical protein
LKFFTGAGNATVNRAGADTLTYLFTSKVTWASNDLILIQTRNETVKWNQVSTNTTTTNKLITLANPVGTNLAIGDTIKKRLPTGYNFISSFPNDATVYHIPTNGNAVVAANDVLLLDRGPSLPLITKSVSSTATSTWAYVTLKTPLPSAVTIGDTIYERSSTNCYITSVTGAGTILNTTNTMGVEAGSFVLVESSAGDLVIREVDSVSANTSITLTAALGFTPTALDRAWSISTTTYTTTLGAEPGGASLILSGSSGLASNDVVVVAATGAQVSLHNLAATPANTNIHRITMSTTFGVAVNPTHQIYKLTNTHALVLTATNTDYELVLNNATNLTAADGLIVLPVSGGVFANQLSGTGVDFAYTQIGLTGQVGVAVAPGDAVYYVNSTNSLPIGAATVRRDGVAIIAADAGRPMRVVLTGTSACAINAITGVYE